MDNWKPHEWEPLPPPPPLPPLPPRRRRKKDIIDLLPDIYEGVKATANFFVKFPLYLIVGFLAYALLQIISALILG